MCATLDNLITTLYTLILLYTAQFLAMLHFFKLKREPIRRQTHNFQDSIQNKQQPTQINSLAPTYGILANIVSGNGLLPDGTKTLPEPMSTHHRRGIHPRAFPYEILTKMSLKLPTYNDCHIPQGPTGYYWKQIMYKSSPWILWQLIMKNHPYGSTHTRPEQISMFCK